jgi:hypothetical protein
VITSAYQCPLQASLPVTLLIVQKYYTSNTIMTPVLPLLSSTRSSSGCPFILCILQTGAPHLNHHLPVPLFCVFCKQEELIQDAALVHTAHTHSSSAVAFGLSSASGAVNGGNSVSLSGSPRLLNQNKLTPLLIPSSTRLCSTSSPLRNHIMRKGCSREVAPQSSLSGRQQGGGSSRAHSSIMCEDAKLV